MLLEVDAAHIKSRIVDISSIASVYFVHHSYMLHVLAQKARQSTHSSG